MKRIAFCFFFAGFCCAEIMAERIKEIQINGNVNIETNAIMNELPVKIGDEYDCDTANIVLKRLHETLYFDDVVVEIRNGIVLIRVVENPIINKIEYEGMKFSTRDSLRDVVKLKPRQVLSKAVIQDTQQLILECYRQQGYLSTRVTPKVVRRENNRVDIIFEVKEGSPTYVKKVAIIGNTAVSSADLREMLSIKEKRVFHLPFLGGVKNKIYEPEKFIADQEMLIRYYLSLGYADFEIVSATAELGPDKKDFFLTYYINEGVLYNFGAVKVSSKIKDLNEDLLTPGIVLTEGQTFNGELLDVSADVIRNLARAAGYNFAVVEPILKKNSENKTVDVTFVVVEGPRVLIERIDINGNKITRDGVIRRDLDFYEGDVFDQKRLKQAETRLKETSFFKGVHIEPKDGSEQGKVIITVDVEEDKTGNIFGNVAYSTLDGMMGEFKVSNNNFAGKAQQLAFQTTFNKNTFECSVELSDPYFLNRNLFGSIEFFHTRTQGAHRTKNTNNGITNNQSGVSPTIGYKISRFVSQHWSYRLARSSVKNELTDIEKKLRNDAELTNKAALDSWLKTDDGKAHSDFIESHYQQKQVTVASSVTHTIGYDRRNRRFFPSKGFQLSWSTKLPCFGESTVMVNTFSGSLHRKLYHELIIHVRGSFSYASVLGNHKLNSVDALSIGGESLRGFDFSGISPSRGWCRNRRVKAYDALVVASTQSNFKDYVQDEKKTREFFEKYKDAWKKIAAGEYVDDASARLAFSTTLGELTLKNEPHARQVSELNMIRRKRLGGTCSWNGSVELTFPIPGVSSDAELFGSFFCDIGSCWRSTKADKNDKTSIKDDDHFARVSIGYCLAWNSPFGMLNLGYAHPLRKRNADRVQKLLFGYGVKFS
jgi:outer membrane protein insertion porin family